MEKKENEPVPEPRIQIEEIRFKADESEGHVVEKKELTEAEKHYVLAMLEALQKCVMFFSGHQLSFVLGCESFYRNTSYLSSKQITVLENILMDVTEKKKKAIFEKESQIPSEPFREKISICLKKDIDMIFEIDERGKFALIIEVEGVRGELLDSDNGKDAIPQLKAINRACMKAIRTYSPKKGAYSNQANEFTLPDF